MGAESATDAPVQAAASVAEFIRSVADELLAYFARRVTPHEDAADCLSETLLVLWRRRESLPTAADERRAWTYGVAHNVLAAHRRGGMRRLALSSRLRDELRVAPIAPSSDDDRAITALASLGARDRELVSLVVWEGLSIAEAGAVIGVRPDAARARYSRARRTLRARLK
ncbi:sigma-70 family RNA polymerase sigma factor [Cryobacterium melibiosiphilum]|uniref:Sigma-70 family RNA polymerase sigma factor n=1 Tax=Cryobacterium melibiosiphilum TaxID=995039 RepID=A0A3A5MB87_9MICO|nr:sigma-70 family RNA polymerase sigma factor [Cryobacterium melibiosiphilum]RJT85609.1 sigma-70 family RNA polymerase sigma factor [Cryobacterium melibiosiphilum]